MKNQHLNSLDKILIFLILSLSCCIILGYFGKYGWFFDLFSHFPLQYFILSSLFFIVLTIRRKRAWSVIALLIFFSQAMKVFTPNIITAAAANQNGEYEEITLMQYNVFKHNKQKEKAVDWLLSQQNVDIIIMEEITPEWATALTRLKEKYVFTEIKEENGWRGIAVFSKLPVESINIEIIGKKTPLAVLKATTKNGTKFVVYGTHPQPPSWPEGWRQRNKTMAEIAKRISAEQNNIILAGDINMTPDSYWFEKFLSESKLKNVGEMTRSWPSILPSIFRIQIDHILVSENISIGSKHLGTANGSDHIPLIVTLKIPSQKEASYAAI